MKTRTVLISGAGIAGPTLAWWLRQYGFEPTIVERAPTPRTGGYMIDFWGIGYQVAERMGLVPALQEAGYTIDELRIVDRTGRRITGFGAQVFDIASGGRYLSFPRGDLASRIFALIDGTVETIFGDSITALQEDDDGVTVSFEHAPQRRFDLVIGADGLHSNVRGLAFGCRSACEQYLGYYTASFSGARYPHRDEGTYMSYSLPGRQVARYALRDGSSAFFFIFAMDAPLSIGHHDVAAQRRVVRERFANAGWECDEMLEYLDGADDLYFDAVAQAHVPAWHAGRVALIGDAAYCPSLLAGQGSAFAMAGSFLLARALGAADGDHRAAFRAWEDGFRPFIEDKQRSAVKFARWFAPRSRFGLAARNATVRLMKIPVVANRIAMATVADQFTLPSTAVQV